MKISWFFYVICISICIPSTIQAQEQKLWHNKTRRLHYTPEGKGFVLKKGTRKFNRALYGTNTAFRVETGDLPEFAMYFPGMGGNLKLGISTGTKSKWLTEVDSIYTKFVPGSMQYVLRDSLLKKGSISIKVVALADKDGFALQLRGENIPKNISLIWLYGGASGKKFSRNGDIGGDPEAVFYLHPDYCVNNEFSLGKNNFSVAFGSENNKKKTGNNRLLYGIFPKSEVHLGSANHQQTPNDAFSAQKDTVPILVGKTTNFKTSYWLFQSVNAIGNDYQKYAESAFNKGLAIASKQAKRVQLQTPDPYLNTLGGSLALAGDAIWEDPAYLHGAVAWRMHLNAWRGAYVADALGWHNRAKTHFRAYGKSQVLEPAFGPVQPDTTRGFARQIEKIGGSMFSNGYISRNPNKNNKAHHYDMNLVFIDQLLRHFNWSGDVQFIKEMWPVIERHLAWEKRNFDVDKDGLYDAYAAIWASDALQYTGGGVTYTSAYNYYANTKAVQLANIVGVDPSPYQKEAIKIKKALDNKLWIPKDGVFAEYKDLLGNQLTHNTPGLWTIYHALDKGVANPFKANELLAYVDRKIPHIPVQASDLEKKDLKLLSTTNWQPYTWSVNNVALAEIAHTALAYWQGNRPEKAFKLWESVLVESMYMGASPGAFEQLLYYDAIRGELYRDFADPVGMTARSLVEGLFGILPNALDKKLTLKPGFPKKWKHASFAIPDISIDFARKGFVDTYKITPFFSTKMDLHFIVRAQKENIEKVLVNNKEVSWKTDATAVGSPLVLVDVPYASFYDISIEWQGEAIETPSLVTNSTNIDFELTTSNAEVLEVKDEAEIFKQLKRKPQQLKGVFIDNPNKTLFVKLQQGKMIWWQSVVIDNSPAIKTINNTVDGDQIHIKLKQKNNSTRLALITVNGNAFKSDVTTDFSIPMKFLVPGTNSITIKKESGEIEELTFINWDVPLQENNDTEMIDISAYFNSEVTDVFENEYLSPRPNSATLMQPTQGIGNWCYPYIKPVINDNGLRKSARKKGFIKSPQGITLKTPSIINTKNISFVSQWDNYPKSIKIPLSGKASHAYFLMAGTTNHMQSRMTNGEVIIYYTDGSKATLELKNPENWWPIEQDYYIDGYAFTTDAPKPPRVHLQTGLITRDFTDYKKIKGFSDFSIDGGAATILDIPLDKNKAMQKLEIKAMANEVVIGLMSVSLLKE